MKKRLILRSLLLSCALACGGLNARAALLYSETFTYTNGTLLTAATPGWSATSGTGTNNITVNNGAVSLATSGQDVSKNFDSTAVSAGTIYAGFDMTVSAAQSGGDYFFSLNASQASSTFNGRIYAKSTTGGYLLGTAAVGTATATYGSDVLSFNQKYRIVIGYTFVTGTLNDTVAVWVSPVSSSSMSYTSGSWGLTQAEVNLQAIVFRQGSASSAPTISGIDDLIVATDFLNAAAIPESSSFAALAGVGALGFCALRRRRSV